MKRDFAKLLRSGVILSSLVLSMTACNVTQQPSKGTKGLGETEKVVAPTETSTVDVWQALTDLSDDFNSGKVEYDEAKKKLDTLASEHASMKIEIEEMKKELTEINASKQAYINAQNAIEQGQYDDAVNYLSEVIQEDSNYSAAQVLLEKAVEKYKAQLEEDITKCAESGNTSGMRTAIGVAKKYLSEEDIKDLSEKLDQAEKTYQETLEKKVEARKIEVEKDIAEAISNKDYKKAVSLCASSSRDPEGYDWDAWYSGKKKEVEDQWITSAIIEAEDHLSKGEVDSALGVLNAPYYNVSDKTKLEEESERVRSYAPVDLNDYEVFYEECEAHDGKLDVIERVNWNTTDIDSAGRTGNKGILFKSTYVNWLTGESVIRWDDAAGHNDAYRIGYLTNGNYDHLKAGLSLTQEAKMSKHSFYIEVYGDNRLLLTSQKQTMGSVPIDIDVPISGVTVLEIRFCWDNATDGESHPVQYVILNPVMTKDYSPIQ